MLRLRRAYWRSFLAGQPQVRPSVPTILSPSNISIMNFTPLPQALLKAAIRQVWVPHGSSITALSPTANFILSRHWRSTVRLAARRNSATGILKSASANPAMMLCCSAMRRVRRAIATAADMRSRRSTSMTTSAASDGGARQTSSRNSRSASLSANCKDRGRRDLRVVTTSNLRPPPVVLHALDSFQPIDIDLRYGELIMRDNGYRRAGEH